MNLKAEEINLNDMETFKGKLTRIDHHKFISTTKIKEFLAFLPVRRKIKRYCNLKSCLILEFTDCCGTLDCLGVLN